MNKIEVNLLDIKSSCDLHVEKFLDMLFDYFVQEGPRNLLNYALNVHSFSESAPLLNLAKDIESNENKLRKLFIENVEKISTEPFEQEEVEHESNKFVLELLDEDVLDEWLKIQSIIKTVETEVGLKLSINLQKYDYICKLLHTEQKISFSAVTIYKSIQSVFENFSLPISVKFNIYNTIKNGLIIHYPNFLVELEVILKDISISGSNSHNISSNVSLNKNKGNSDNIYNYEISAVENSDTIDIEKDNLNSNNHIHDTDLQSILSLLNKESTRMQFANVSKNAASQQVHNSLLSSKNSLQLLSQLNRNVTDQDNLLYSKTKVNKEINTSSDINSTNFNIADLIEGLQYVIKDTTFDITNKSKAQPYAKVEKYLVDNKKSSSGIPTEYKETIDGAAYLFSKAKSEYKENSDIKNLLKRLERPILKLMLTDTDFMVSPQHPARDVVNLIDECTMATNSKEQIIDKRLLKFLALQVDEIDSKFATDPDVFLRVRAKLLKVLIPIRRARKNRMFKAQQKFQSHQLITNAKSRIDAFLESSLPGSERPRILNEVLEQGWYQNLILQQLSNDQVKRSETTSIIELFINILLGEIKFNESDLSDLVEELINGFKLIGTDTHVIYSMRAYIHDELTKPVEDIEWVEVQLIQPELNDSSIFKSIQSLDPGTWWQFNINSTWQSRQLVWKSKNGQQLGFVNRSVTETVMISLKTFADDFNNDKIRDYPQQILPLMERSEHGLFDESYTDMIHSALHDPVTDLLNKKGLISKVSQVANMSGLDICHSICQIEFDQINIVNLNCGMSASERLISNLADILSKSLVNNQYLAQISADTFIVFLPSFNKTKAEQFCLNIINKLSNFRFEHDREIYSIGLSIGYLEFSPTLLNVVDLLSKVDSACRAAKLQGRNTLIEYNDEDLYLQAQQAMKEWAGRIDRILENNGLYLRCQRVQPIDQSSGLEAYYEILLGIKDLTDSDTSNDENKYRQISPSHFFPALELWKRSYEVDLWVLTAVFDWIRSNENLFSKIGGFAVNLSAQSLNNIVVLNYLRSELSKGDLPNSKISFEITETAAIESYGKAQEFMNEIRKLGCVFSLDDFGAGFSSYSHLKNLNTNTLKIDGSFVKDIVESPTDRMMVRSMNELGKFLGMKTVAEFVENEEILEILKEIGVDYAQGYALHKPMPISQLEKEFERKL